jgi:ABC-type transporter Mla maintaining outer membrane lipid asymmetry ATPase subunit MlaF
LVSIPYFLPDMGTVGDSQNNLVEIRGLSFARGDVGIFNGVSMNFQRGKVTAIMGPSGTGKTTLLKLIGGQLQPSQGTVRVDGNNVHRLRRGELFSLRKRMGMLFQSGALLTDMNVYDNVAFPLREHAGSHDPHPRVDEIGGGRLAGGAGLDAKRAFGRDGAAGRLGQGHRAGSHDDNV